MTIRQLPPVQLHDLPARTEPLYVQLQKVLRTYVRSHSIGEICLLPAERTLAEAYGVSRITVRKALAGLTDEGVISRRRGIGTAVIVQQADAPQSVAGLTRPYIRPLSGSI